MNEQKLEIMSCVELNDKKLKMIKEFNQYYDNWINAHDDGLSFVEMQHKLMHLLYYIKESMEKSTGLIQLCKLEPCILIKYASMSQEDEAISMTIQEMFLDIISYHCEQFNVQDFESNMGGSNRTIMSNTETIGKIIVDLYQYRDLEYIFKVNDEDDDDETSSCQQSRQHMNYKHTYVI